jgi:hypothetical protein
MIIKDWTHNGTRYMIDSVNFNARFRRVESYNLSNLRQPHWEPIGPSPDGYYDSFKDAWKAYFEIIAAEEHAKATTAGETHERT